MNVIALSHPGDGTIYEPWCSPSDLDDVGDDSVDLSSVCQVATELLFVMSGRQFGIRRVTLRPMVQESCLEIGLTMNRELVLPSPVREIVEVKLNGLVLSGSDYRLIGRKRLVRVPSGHWPMFQNLALDDDQPNTFAVTLRWGKDVPEGGKVAAFQFAKQIALYLSGNKKSALSDRQVSVTRQGVAKTYLDPSEFTRLNKTGLYLVDQWLTTVNPSGGRRKPRIL